MSDFIVIGGGLIGMLTARELLNAGAKVTLIEQGQVGREASWAGGGIISPLYPWRYHASITALASWGQPRYAALAEALHSESGIDPEYTRSGLLIVDPDDAQTALAWAETTGQSLQMIDPAAVHQCEPALRTEAQHAVWMPEVAQIRNPRLVKAAFHAINDRIEVLAGTPVTGLLTEDGHIGGVETPQGTHAADAVIICAGAWSGKLLRNLMPQPRIEPVLGQMILFRARPDAIRRIVLHQERYVIPRRDGRVLVGSTLEYRGFDKQTTEATRDALAAYALERFPLLRESAIEHHWAGLRPGSPQGIPYIGPVPGVKGLFVNAGHFRNGVVLGPASARLAADLALGRDPIVPTAPYALAAPRE